MVRTGISALFLLGRLRRCRVALGWTSGRGNGGRPRREPCKNFVRVIGSGLLIILFSSVLANSRVLNEKDLQKVSEIKPLFTNIMDDLVQSSKRSDLSAADTNCINSTIQELLQISQELSTYEYLIAIEDQVKDFGDDNTIRGILRFAVDKVITILASERGRLSQLRDQCARYPLSFGKTQKAIQFIDTTADILTSIQPRL